jgi:hypothetical protein
MPKMSHAREYHLDMMPAGGLEHFGITHGPSGLNNRSDPMLGSQIDRIREGKESVRSKHSSAGLRTSRIQC